MKQVKLWIEENPFSKGIIYETERNHYKDVVEIDKIIESQARCYDPDCDYLSLNDGCSRETIIQALWEYQKSLLPLELSDTGKLDLNEWNGIIDKHGEDIEFYNPVDRIITITEFEDGNKNV